MFSIEKAKELFRKKGSFRVHYNKENGDEFQPDWTRMESIYVMSTSGHIFFRLTAYHNWLDDRQIFLSDFSIDEEFRGKGIGDKTLDKIIEVCKELGGEQLILGVEEDSEDSWVEKWYERKGFKHYEYDEENRNIMSLDLKTM